MDTKEDLKKRNFFDFLFGGEDEDDDYYDIFNIHHRNDHDDFFDDLFGKSNNDDYYNDDYYNNHNDDFYNNHNDDFNNKPNNDDYYNNHNDDYYNNHNDDYYNDDYNIPNIGDGSSNLPPQNNPPNYPPINIPQDNSPSAPTNKPPQNNSPSAPTTNPSNNSQSGSLPIKDLTMTGFNKCTSSQAEQLKYLIEDIKTYRAAALYVTEHQNEDSNFNKIFLRHFKDNSVLPNVQRIFENVNNLSTVEAYCEPASDQTCSDNAIAWTYGNSQEFHVCPDFFTDVMYGSIAEHKSEAASIIVHELTHCFGSEDYAYGESECDTLDPERASYNADTLKYFAMSSIYYLNDKKNGINMYMNGERKLSFRPIPFKDKVIKRPVNNNKY